MRTITVILVIWQLDANFACDTSQVAASMRARMTSFYSRFWTFWLTVCGSNSRKWMLRGALYFARCSRQKPKISSSVARCRGLIIVTGSSAARSAQRNSDAFPPMAIMTIGKSGGRKAL
jgi:hypothetical protein